MLLPSASTKLKGGEVPLCLSLLPPAADSCGDACTRLTVVCFMVEDPDLVPPA